MAKPRFVFLTKLSAWGALNLLVSGAFVFLVGCETIPAPVQDYALARAALDACKSVEAAKYSAGFYHRGLENYSRAEVLYREREFKQARELFVRARADFEKAENSAQVQRKKSGEVL